MNQQTHSVEILDCTLRDASYPIAYQFSAEDTAVIALGLEEAGFRKIEIGHGLGLGASTSQYGLAAATDEEYLAAAASVLTRAKFGVFMIPGIATRSHLELVAKYKAGFVRIGTNVDQTDQAEEFIKFAKDHGMEVSANLMKTYAAPVAEVVKRSEQLVRWGADVISVVDSAGGMFPDEVGRYVRTLKESVAARIGFHGHNNMQLAVANSLAAIQAGASVVDGTLRGLGRSSGNAQTEVLVMALDRMGIKLDIDIYKVMDLADKVIGPLFQCRGVNSLELTSGYALFHSSFMNTIERVADETGVDPRELIIRVSAINKVNVSEALARKVAADIQNERQSHPVQAIPQAFNLVVSQKPCPRKDIPLAEEALQIVQEMKSIAKKTGRSSLFTIAMAPLHKGRGAWFPFIRLTATQVIGNAEVENAAQAVEIVSAVDGLVDCILLDSELRPAPSENALLGVVAPQVKKSRLLAYRDGNAHLDAAEALISRLMGGVSGSKIGVCGLSSFGLKLAMRLMEMGASVYLWDLAHEKVLRSITLLEQWCQIEPISTKKNVFALEKEGENLDLLVGTALSKAVVGENLVERVASQGLVIDAGVGSLQAGAIERAIGLGLRLYRLDMRAGLSGQIALVLDTDDLVSRLMGVEKLAEQEIVAGGAIGRRGAIIVDAIHNPTRVIGVADGRGGLLSGAELAGYEENIQSVKAELLRQRLPTSR